MPRFVLEIGTEEIPPRYFPVALPQLKANGEAMLKRARLALPETEVKVHGTPRRLVLVGEEIAAAQAPAVREERGPAARVAFDAQGKPTKAAMGFAKRHGLAPEQLERRQTDQGEYVFATIQEPQHPARVALAAMLPGLIKGIPFPKTMRWGTGTLRFGRPIRWLLALVDDQVVEFELDGTKSGRLTRGHPVLAEGVFAVPSAADYERALRDRSVIVEPDERLHLVYQGLQDIHGRTRASSDFGVPGVRNVAELVANAEGFAETIAWNLAVQTAFLVEHPTVACGRFDEAFLQLPEEVLVEEMQHVQSYFPLKDQGKLVPRFAAIRDGGDEHLDVVVAGWENVLKAKLIDASYFYEEDLKKPLADRVGDLKGVVFQEDLGSMFDKMQRIRAVAADAAEQLALSPGVRRDLDRAAYLCKADLTTEMVTDLSGLQGTMGAIYARENGESTLVWEAIQQHYWPRSANDGIPLIPTGTLLAIVDRLDTLAAFLAAGIMPTGSADPFGLRREAYGLIRILAPAPQHGTHTFRLSLSSLLQCAVRALHGQFSPEKPVSQTVSDVMGFLRDRLAAYLRERHIRYDLVDAALAVGVDDICETWQRAEALSAIHSASHFLPTVIAATRPMNISKDFEGSEVDPGLFQEDAERALWAAFQEAKLEAEPLADDLRYVDFFRVLGRLREPIDRFFDEVLVMHEDERIRNNRLAMCWQISQLFRRLADFTLIVQT